MDLAKIEHLRCGSHEDRATYVWVPTDMDKPELDDLINKARHQCVEAEKAAEGIVAPPHHSWWDFLDKADQSKTLAAVKAEYAEQEIAWKLWAQLRDAKRKSFAERLKYVSGGSVSLFHEEEFAISAECDWGHNHGVKVDYGATAEGQEFPCFFASTEY